MDYHSHYMRSCGDRYPSHSLQHTETFHSKIMSANVIHGKEKEKQGITKTSLLGMLKGKLASIVTVKCKVHGLQYQTPAQNNNIPTD